MNGLDDIEEKFRRLEREVNDVKAEINSDNSDNSAQDQQSRSTGIVGAFKTSLADLVRWINGMTGASKVVAVVVLGLLVFTVIGFVLKLVTAAISLAILAAVVWLLYKLFFESNSPST